MLMARESLIERKDAAKSKRRHGRLLDSVIYGPTGQVVWNVKIDANLVLALMDELHRANPALFVSFSRDPIPTHQRGKERQRLAEVTKPIR